jgi:TetR/AcrR family transcriptional regulator, cholesterol catabolism regulator
MAGRQTAVRKRGARSTGSGKNKAEAGGAGGDRRALIIEAAARRFAEFGFEATTVRQIADEVDILSGSLYHHFATKEEILEEIVREAVREQLDCALETAALDGDAEQRLVTLMVRFLGVATTRPDAHAVLFHERRLFRRNPDFAHIVKARKKTYDVWCAILEEGVAEGLFLADLDIYMTITTTMRMIYNGAEWYIHEDGSPIDAMGDYSLEDLSQFYVGFVLRSIRAPGRASEPIPQPAGEG